MNDERPIEKLLRRYAKKRREDAGAPLELHPATRRLLQGEVARQFRKAGAEASSSTGWLATLRQRWIYATAAVGAVVVAAIVFFNSDPTGVGELAKQNTSADAPPVNQPAEEIARKVASPESAPLAAAERRDADKSSAAPASAALEEQKATDEYKQPVSRPAGMAADSGNRREAVALSPTAVAPEATLVDKESPPAPKLAGKSTAADNLRLTEPVAIPVPASAPAAPTRSAPTAARTRATYADALTETKAGKDGDAAARVAATPPPVNAPTGRFERSYAPLARGGGLERDRQAAAAQSFANTAFKAKTEASAVTPTPGSPVLMNFQVVQAGEQWQVIDGDGSTYLGDAVSAPVPAKSDSAKGATALKLQTVRTGNKDGSALDQFYRVAGTNRTLNQQVVFTWNFVAPTNAPGQSPTPAVGALLNQSSLNSTQQFPGLYNNSGIIGRAQINAGREIEVRAAPVGP